MDAYWGYAAGYGLALAAAWVLIVARPALLAGPDLPEFRRPWVELAIFILGIVGVLAVGQAYVRGWLLPEPGFLAGFANQVLIFLPVLLIIALRPFPLRTGFLAPNRMLSGLVIGIVLAGIALAAHAAARGWLGEFDAVLATVFHLGRAHHFAQVLMEDVAIVALVTRIIGVSGPRTAITLAGALFAAAHIPALLAGGADLAGLITLVLDAGLAVAALGAILATRNIWWFFPVHAVMDMTQFHIPAV
ncbi:hypothetical protein [Hyphobacterium marinum]|uniref:CPBP family intramembrane metalloprotease n=1 Tax=Hyphobacterium marinum TaxID=3116574 RepID=A0ABU7LXY7_9PROT|nr:hypothetical protein [Hyphobacterium sp. Y6023]MEE2566429.1 hypothetical protein [Hyphobacterium sp. Y6023]